MVCLQSCELRSPLMQQCLILLFYWLRWILDFLAIGQIRSHQRPGLSQSAYWESEPSFDSVGWVFFLCSGIKTWSLCIYTDTFRCWSLWSWKGDAKRNCSRSLDPAHGCPQGLGLVLALLFSLRCDLWGFSVGLGFVPLLLGLLTGQADSDAELCGELNLSPTEPTLYKGVKHLTKPGLLAQIQEEAIFQ